MNKPALKPWVITEIEGAIVASHCDCMAGLGESCTHVAALLFYIEAAVKLHKSKTVTEEKAYWTLPPALKHINYTPANQVNFSHPNKLRKHFEKKLPDDQTSRAKLDQQSKIPKPSSEEIDELMQKIKDSGTKSVILSLKPPFSDEFVPLSTNTSLPKPLLDLCNKNAMKMNENELRCYCKSLDISITCEQASLIEKYTRGQSTCKLWHKYRAGRITASKMKMACTTGINKPSDSLIQSICRSSSLNLQTPAISWGNAYEGTARKEFIESQKSFHKNFSVSENGLFINPTYPFLGASPDGIVLCDCCPIRLLEIKCPYTNRDRNLNEEQGNFYLKKNESGFLKLDRTHEYYYQVQTQLGVCEVQEAYFVVWNTCSIHIELIKFDEEHWTEMTNKAENLFNSAILLELVGRFYSLGKHKSNFLPLVHDQRNICYCSTEKGEYSTVTCNGTSCKIRYFHVSCLYFDKAPPKKAGWLCPDCKGQNSKLQVEK